MDGFEALADPTRRKIIQLVATGPRPAGEIARHFSVSRPAISQHLNILSASEILEVEPRGRQRIYSLNKDALEGPLIWLEAQRQRWNAALDRLESEMKKEG